MDLSIAVDSPAELLRIAIIFGRNNHQGSIENENHAGPTQTSNSPETPRDTHSKRLHELGGRLSKRLGYIIGGCVAMILIHTILVESGWVRIWGYCRVRIYLFRFDFESPNLLPSFMFNTAVSASGTKHWVNARFSEEREEVEGTTWRFVVVVTGSRLMDHAIIINAVELQFN
ncbi:uncharacterized protein F5891DRAFT_978126 [Suillus fuscotomentosus]|uniref:Uncharacterized protein n=1 Tax=Suillus fuscotomentosus TaxID=1912939 RepID=A0AAD4HNS2_9AGAM|nr:uncharacterized protein F5891DRAFT_978126 [Suillus fuscotomentosus]KAG1903086.1 hypothetical protein F5891DRAFT_978126 [Suillus fuscotomentosus]